MTATVAATARTPRRPALDRPTARRLMTTEYQLALEQLRSLSPEDWRVETCNPGWDVRALAAHMLGMAAMAASLREQLRQMGTARKRGGEFIDALTAVQVETYEGWSPERIVEQFARLAPKAVQGRMRMPALLRDRRMSGPQPVNPPHEYEPWTFAYLLEAILTRDPWMHRSDIAAATGREMALSAEHDGVLVDDVAREWARRHGRPCTLTLTGPAGGEFRFGTGETAGLATYTLDAVQFCRILSGRGPGEGLLGTRVPF